MTPTLDMEVLIATAALLSALVVGTTLALGRYGLRRYSSNPPNRTYTPCEALFTQGERVFFGVLDDATGPDYRVFGKVRVADVITPKQGMKGDQWHRAFSPICAKHFDFVLCDPDDLRIHAVVELDDRSHDRPERRARDAMIDRACADAGVPIVHIKAARRYDRKAVRQAIAQSIRGVSKD